MGSIPLSDSIRVVGKKHSWELQRLRVKNGEKVWQPFKYFTTLGQAMAQAGEREVRLSEGTSLAEAIETYTQVSHRYEELLDNAISELIERVNTKQARSEKTE